MDYDELAFQIWENEGGALGEIVPAKPLIDDDEKAEPGAPFADPSFLFSQPR